jgi:hypothetical protein
VAYTQAIERKKTTRYRGCYKDADGRYKSAGTYNDEDRALKVAQEAEKPAALVSGITGGKLDPVVRATRTIEEYALVFLRHHRVEGNTKDTYEITLYLHGRRRVRGSGRAPWADLLRRRLGAGVDIGRPCVGAGRMIATKLRDHVVQRSRGGQGRAVELRRYPVGVGAVDLPKGSDSIGKTR